MRTLVTPPQELADTHTLIAQRYAGYFLGYHYRAAQQRTDPKAFQIDMARPWKEPAVVSDDCTFCARMTDESAARRIDGYQHAIDIEVLRPYTSAYLNWLSACGDEVVEIEEVQAIEGPIRRGIASSAVNRRRFIETHADIIQCDALRVIDLPLRLKRKLCIEWNHVYTSWMAIEPDVEYDFELRQFYRETHGAEPAKAPHAEDEPLESWWRSLAAGAYAAGGS